MAAVPEYHIVIFSKTIKLMMVCGVSLIHAGPAPFHRLKGPSAFIICFAQSAMPAYCPGDEF